MSWYTEFVLGGHKPDMFVRPAPPAIIMGVPAEKFVKILAIINELAPGTRRDEWWASEGPYVILAKHLTEQAPKK